MNFDLNTKLNLVEINSVQHVLFQGTDKCLCEEKFDTTKLGTYPHPYTVEDMRSELAYLKNKGFDVCIECVKSLYYCGEG